MAKGKKNTDIRIEIWLPRSVAKYIGHNMTRENESRKQAIERITTTAHDRHKAKNAETYKSY